ncbi:hypothetical protein WMF30_47095 [Sorangium sp. So ce134]
MIVIVVSPGPSVAEAGHGSLLPPPDPPAPPPLAVVPPLLAASPAPLPPLPPPTPALPAPLPPAPWPLVPLVVAPLEAEVAPPLPSSPLPGDDEHAASQDGTTPTMSAPSAQ